MRARRRDGIILVGAMARLSGSALIGIYSATKAYQHAPQFGGAPERRALGLRPFGFGERGVHECDRRADLRCDRCEAIEIEVVEIGSSPREHLPAFVDREPAEIDPQRLDREPARTL